MWYGKINNIRWYRNNVYEIDNSNESASATSPTNTQLIISWNSGRSSATDALGKKTTKCVVNVSSSRNDSK